MRERLIAEGIGTFALVFMGCGAIVANDLTGGTVGHVGIALVFGLVVMAVIHAFGEVSGAHINPAVTLGFAAAGRFPKREVLPYVGVQVAGALVGAGALRLILGPHPTLGATLPAAGLGLGSAFALEAIMTAFLMAVILGVSTGAKEKGIMAGAAIGGTVALAALWVGPLTGASLNPARSLGPALVAGRFDVLWLYLAAPVLGALAAAPVCRLVYGSGCCPGDETPACNT